MPEPGGGLQDVVIDLNNIPVKKGLLAGDIPVEERTDALEDTVVDKAIEFTESGKKPKGYIEPEIKKAPVSKLPAPGQAKDVEGISSTRKEILDIIKEDYTKKGYPDAPIIDPDSSQNILLPQPTSPVMGGGGGIANKVLSFVTSIFR